MASILVIEDKDSLREILYETLKRNKSYEVHTIDNGRDAEKMILKGNYDIVLSDYQIPYKNGMEILKFCKKHSSGTLVIMMTAYGTIEIAVQAMKYGAFDFITKPVSIDQLKIAITKAVEHKQIIRENIYFKSVENETYSAKNLLGDSDNIKQVKKLIRKVAPTPSTILITGESGTGKELVAHAIKSLSNRKSRVFIKVHLAALSGNLIESELFGHEQGAFTGANKRHIGRFELADTGTIFLDEIGELNQDIQVKLLRVLQEKEFERVGGTGTIKTDVRIIAATNKNLYDEVKKGNFREDLYYRLNVFQINLPPLRERKADMELLVNHFIKKYGHHGTPQVKKIDKRAINILKSYTWPGNVRELENIIERACVLAEEGIINVGDININSDSEYIQDDQIEFPLVLKEKVIDFEKELIKKAYEESNAGLNKTARLLGITKQALYNKLKKYSLEYYINKHRTII